MQARSAPFLPSMVDQNRKCTWRRHMRLRKTSSTLSTSSTWVARSFPSRMRRAEWRSLISRPVENQRPRLLTLRPAPTFRLEWRYFGDWGWETHPKLTFGLWYERAECEFVGANFAEAQRLISELLSRSKSKIDRAAAYRLKIHLHMVESANLEAIRCGLDCLRMFGVVMPAHPTREDVQIEYT